MELDVIESVIAVSTYSQYCVWRLGPCEAAVSCKEDTAIFPIYSVVTVVGAVISYYLV